VWHLYELTPPLDLDNFDLCGTELLALSSEELQHRSEHGNLLYEFINSWLREPGE
jgi:hypothetical protein